MHGWSIVYVFLSSTSAHYWKEVHVYLVMFLSLLMTISKLPYLLGKLTVFMSCMSIYPYLLAFFFVTTTFIMLRSLLKFPYWKVQSILRT